MWIAMGILLYELCMIALGVVYWRELDVKPYRDSNMPFKLSECLGLVGMFMLFGPIAWMVLEAERRDNIRRGRIEPWLSISRPGSGFKNTAAAFKLRVHRLNVSIGNRLAGRS